MPALRRRLLWVLPLVLVVAAAGYWFVRNRREPPQFTLGAVDRGDIAEVVGATGTLEAVTTVQIGSQVSGTIQTLYADFNSTVHKGQVIARLDPAIFDARVGQAQANLVSARANTERSRSAVEDARLKYQRARELAAQNLVPQSDLDTAKATYDGAVAQLKASDAAVSQAVAAVNQAKLDLSHTVISTPIDGVVISRNVDVGQTVAASFQAPVLFVIANDLRKMRVNASIDEADVGRVREGQDVLFHVDAFPDRDFWGRVEQVRLNPTTVSNVVTYNAIVAVDNGNLLLRPGMTATVSVQVRKAADTLRLPASALRFRPEGFERPTGGGSRRGSAGPAQGENGQGGAAATGGRRGGASASAEPAGAAAQGGGDSANPSARQRRWPRGQAGAEGARAAAPVGAPPGPGDDSGRGRRTTVFVPGPDGNPAPVQVSVGISDGQYVELRGGLSEGATVITGTQIPGSPAGPRPGSSPSTNPFQPQFQRRQR